MRFARWFSILPLRLRSLFRRNRVEQELDEEIRYHLERQVEDNIKRGMGAEEARYAALRALNGLEQRKEECRDMRRVGFIETVIQDLRYAIRQLRLNPTFTIVAVVILALGIGANIAIFRLVDTILLKKLPVKDPDGLYFVEAAGFAFSYPGYELLRDINDVFSDTFTVAGDEYNIIANGQPDFIRVDLVTGNFFSALGVNVRAGRPITENDDSAVAVISDSYWQKTFGRDAAVIGSSITISSVPFTIVGVAPPEFFGVTVGSAPQMWIPIEMLPRVEPGNDNLASSGTLWLTPMARLKPGVSEAQARANLAVVLPAVRQKMANGKLQRIDLSPAASGFSRLREQYSLALRILMVVVGIVLLIACANLANLLMSRGTARRREMAIRLAIGAARPRLVRQLLTENLLLATLGGSLGLLFAIWSNTLLVAFIAGGGLQLSLDVRTLAFSATVSLLTAVLFGVTPSLRATRLNLLPDLKEDAPGRAGTRQRVRHVLIAAQVALSLFLLTGAGLFVRTVQNLRTSDLGFDPRNTVVMTIEPGLAGYKDSAVTSLFQEILDRVQAIPGVRSASISRFGMIGGGYAARGVSVPGYIPPQDKEPISLGRMALGNQVASNAIGPRFFETAGIPLLAGREFGPGDVASASPVAIVNTRFARRYFGVDNPIGKTFGFQPPPAPQLEIVGVVQDAKFFQLRNDSPATVFVSLFQPAGFIGGRAFLAIRTEADPAGVIGAVRGELYSIARDMPVHDARTQAEQLDVTLVRERLLATLSGFFSLLALLLACVGLYGVMSYSVAQRTTEIGVRVALGAKRSDILRLVLRESLWMVFAGVAAGIGASLALTRFVSSLLFGVTPNDPATIALAVALMTTIALLAAWLPARRASHVDPMIALRHE
jgi:predicted permease